MSKLESSSAALYLEGDGMPGVDHAARHLVGGEAELGEARVVQQLRGQDVDRALPGIR